MQYLRQGVTDVPAIGLKLLLCQGKVKIHKPTNRKRWLKMDRFFLLSPQFLTIVLHPQEVSSLLSGSWYFPFLMYSHILCGIDSSALFGLHRHLEYRPMECSWELHMHKCLCWSWKEQIHFKGAMESHTGWIRQMMQEMGKDNGKCGLNVTLTRGLIQIIMIS